VERLAGVGPGQLSTRMGASASGRPAAVVQTGCSTCLCGAPQSVARRLAQGWLPGCGWFSMSAQTTAGRWHYREKGEDTMKQLLRYSTSFGFTLMLAALPVLLVTMSFTGAVSAAEDTARCTLRTLRGTYVFAAHGVLNDGKSVLPYAEAGTWTLDGSGHARGVFSASLNGKTIANRESFTATYRLDSDCVFTALAPLGDELLEFHLYPTDQGATMTYFTAGVSGTQFRR
jgi:hypothetical protein